MDDLTESEHHARNRWHYHGQCRPAWAIAPQAGQCSVWDYPRPPALALEPLEIVVILGNHVVARTQRAVRVMETASPPTYYLPRSDVDQACLTAHDGQSHCEWKGASHTWTVMANGQCEVGAAWSYESPNARFAMIAGHLGFYAGRLACFVGGIRVAPQPGRFYAGWITPDVVGPFKGEPGTGHW